MGAIVHRRWFMPVVMAGCLLAGGCDAAGDGAGNAASTPEAARSADSTPSRGAGCPAGRYAVTDLDATSAVEVDGAQVTLAGGGGMTFTLTGDGAWTLSGDGSEPVTASVTVEGRRVTGTATITGRLRGTYAKSGDAYRFSQEGGDGTVVVKALGQTRRHDITDLGPALVPDGVATITCTDDGATVKSKNVTMTLDRVGDPDGDSVSPPGDGSDGGTDDGGKDGAKDPIRVTGRLTSVTHKCDGHDVVVSGTLNTVNLRGDCRRVEVSGNNNVINVERVDSVVLTGNHTVVNIQRGAATGDEPDIVDRGSFNKVNRAT